jgi:hypothetical protein
MCTPNAAKAQPIVHARGANPDVIIAGAAVVCIGPYLKSAQGAS